MPLTRRRATRTLAALSIFALVVGTAACSAGGDTKSVQFNFSKREAITYMTQVVADFNASQDEYQVNMDTSGREVVAAGFVRGNPPDLLLTNYNHQVSRFISRCAVSDLSDTVAATTVRPDLQPLLDQYGVCPGTTPALPFSVMSASVIYNKEIFAEHDLEVPTTWSELIEVSDTLKAAGVAPFYATFADPWTVNQGWFDYAIGGSGLDILEFYKQLGEEGTNVGPNAAVSFEKEFLEPVEKMQLLAKEYTQSDATSRTYDFGNTAFSRGEGAMYLQGPWGLSEVSRNNPDLELGSFPLPMTDDPADLKVRINMDLVAMIPNDARNPEGARAFTEYLFQPEIIQGYNDQMLGYAPTLDGKDPDDPRIEGMTKYYNDGAVYQGPGVLNPRVIPTENYAQSLVLGEDAKTILRRMDADWARLAFRQPAVATEEGQ